MLKRVPHIEISANIPLICTSIEPDTLVAQAEVFERNDDCAIDIHTANIEQVVENEEGVAIGFVTIELDVEDDEVVDDGET